MSGMEQRTGNATRVARYRERNAKEYGLDRRDCYVHAEDWPRVTALVAKLAQRRKRQAAREARERARIERQARKTTQAQGC